MYTDAIINNQPAFTYETLTPVDRLNEKIMTGLRTIEGFDSNILNELVEGKIIDRGAQDKFKFQVDRYVKEGMMTLNNHHIILTRKGMYIADGLASNLFL